jgi:hypothetical protein
MATSTKPTTLEEVWSRYETSGAQVTAKDRRQFMGGALAAIELLRSGATASQLHAECVQFGRAIGTKAEKLST